MAPIYTSLFYGPNRQFVIVLLLTLILSCTRGTKVYESDCDAGQTFKRVTFAHLLDSLAWYDQQYVETTGIYRDDKVKSALYNDSTTIKPDNRALWVNFSPECPLYLKGSHIGFFDYNDGSFTRSNNKKVRIRGKIDIHNQGHLKLYKGCIDRISLVDLVD